MSTYTFAKALDAGNEELDFAATTHQVVAGWEGRVRQGQQITTYALEGRGLLPTFRNLAVEVAAQHLGLCKLVGSGHTKPRMRMCNMRK